VHAIRRGDAVADPRDAPLALELIDRQRALGEHVFAGRWWRRFDRVTDAWMVLVVICLALVARNLLIVGLACLPELWFVALRLSNHRTERRFASSRAKNQQLIDRLS
jgi:hypothetical protein